jgi:hypothetical protein
MNPRERAVEISIRCVFEGRELISGVLQDALAVVAQGPCGGKDGGEGPALCGVLEQAGPRATSGTLEAKEPPVMEVVGGNKSLAAKTLGLDRKTPVPQAPALRPGRQRELNRSLAPAATRRPGAGAQRRPRRCPRG